MFADYSIIHQNTANRSCGLISAASTKPAGHESSFNYVVLPLDPIQVLEAMGQAIMDVTTYRSIAHAAEEGETERDRVHASYKVLLTL